MRSYPRTAIYAGAGGLLSLLAFNAGAFPFEMGPVQGRLDTTLSAGATWRMQSADHRLIGIANGGSSRSANEDDGNYGFANGDIVSAVAKATHDLELNWNNYGLFSRFSYFYDTVASDADRLQNRLNAAGLATASRQQGDYELGRRGRERLGREGDLLDLFVHARFDVGGRMLAVRFGKQVVSWGESTFIQNGINSINPIDVARIRAPGAELKEALIPTAMLWTSFSLTQSLSIEGVWLTEFEKTRLDPRGSFFSTNDFASDDGNKAILGFGRRSDDNQAVDLTEPGSVVAWVPRAGSPQVDDPEKQFGVALRYFSEALGSTEFGLYYLSLHSRIPLISGYRGAATSPANLTLPSCVDAPTDPTCRAAYYTEYPGNIDIYGLSFNTDGPFGIALQGEYSYRPELPFQLAAPEILLTALGVPSTVYPVPVAATGTDLKGYREVEAHQVQLTLTKAFGPSLGAQQFIMLAEIGYNHFKLPKDLRFNAPGIYLPSCRVFRALPAVNQAVVSNGSCQEDVGGGYASDSSWGYRWVNRLDFENVIGPLGLSPRFVFSHDVNGVGPNFNQDTRAVTVGLAFNYLQRWQADIGYTTFFGGRTYAGTDVAVPAPGTVLVPGTIVPGESSQPLDFSSSANPSKDRDFIAISLSYAF